MIKIVVDIVVLLFVLLLIIKKIRKSSRLYIIGNGFDIYHGINSKYSNFKYYVEENDNDLYEMLEEYFDTDSLWSDFEETLAYIDIVTIVDDAENYLRDTL
ncbi:AbiH family protein [Cellulophaga baltica]|uniref:AbiH family protein n=1 Tax=Cellulophaga baltica TaxID=76594 RepID=UPI002493F9DE|nr:AbiH family protein [Cellulophaga baltica]